MAYIGIQPAESFTSFATQEFSTSATTSYTLDHAVANENELALFVNNVRQQPGSGKAYTATGTALTLSAATASTDTMYCVFLGRALQTVVPATNSITAAMVGNDLISGKDALTSEPATTDEILISDAGTLKRIDYSLTANTPAFEAYQSSTQSGVGDAVWTKITMNTETFDSDSAYDNSSNYRFTPQTAGKYFVYVMGGCLSDTTYKLNVANIAIYKNGSYYRATNHTVNGADRLNEATTTTTAIVDMNGSSDYVEAYARVNVTTGTGSIDARLASGGFGAYRITGL